MTRFALLSLLILAACGDIDVPPATDIGNDTVQTEAVVAFANTSQMSRAVLIRYVVERTARFDEVRGVLVAGAVIDGGASTPPLRVDTHERRVVRLDIETWEPGTGDHRLSHSFAVAGRTPPTQCVVTYAVDSAGVSSMSDSCS